MDATADSEACVVSLAGNKAVRVPLMSCVEKTQDVAKAMADKDWNLAVELRGKSFGRNLETYKMLTKHKPKNAPTGEGTGYNLGVINVGAPACGMNGAVRSFVRNAIACGNKPFGIHNGMEGFAQGNIDEIQWSDVNGWVVQGGALLGTKRTLPANFLPEIAAQIKKFKLNGLLIIGGFEAFHSALQLTEARDKFEEFCIPMTVLPATISNNVPGTDFTIGADTALNEITEICDRIRQSAAGTKRRVFIVETMGGYCGYLATMAGLAGGSDAAYIHEEPFKVKDLLRDLEILRNKIDKGKIERGLVLRNEKANENYTTDFLYSLYCEEGKGSFSTRKNVLGHMQQGGKPSPFDRNMSTKMGAKCYHWLVEKITMADDNGVVRTKAPESACVLGMRTRHYQFQSLQGLKEETDFTHRRWKRIWWMNIREEMKILARHDSNYVVQVAETVPPVAAGGVGQAVQQEQVQSQPTA